MNWAQSYVWLLLHPVEQVDSCVPSDLAGQAPGDPWIADPEQRRLDMEAAVGAWAERLDLPDSKTYISNLRNEIRERQLIPA